MRAIRIKLNSGEPDQPLHLTQMVEICQDDITVSETMEWIWEMIGNRDSEFYRSEFLKKVGMPESWVIIAAAKTENLKLNEVATYLAGGKKIYGDALFINFYENEDGDRFEAITSKQSSELIPEFVKYCVLADQGNLLLENGKCTV